MRLCYVLPNLETGGLQRAILNNALANAQHAPVDFVVYALHEAPDGDTTMHDQLVSNGAEVVIGGVDGRADRSPRALFASARRLRKFVDESSVDIVDSAIFEADLTARLALLGTDVPLVTHLVNTTWSDPGRLRSIARHPLRPFLAKQIDALSARRTDRFVAITRVVATAGTDTLRIPEDKMTVIYRGVDLELFDAQPLAGSTSETAFLVMGRLAHQKRVDVAIRAFSRVMSEGASARLTIAGDGPLRGQLEQQVAELGIAASVSFAGRVTDPARFYQSHDCLLFPSGHEGLGNTALEAMASGRFVVASDIPVLREVLGTCAWFAPVGDHIRLSERMLEVCELTTAQLQELGASGRERVESSFESAKAWQDRVQLYKQVLQRRGKVS